MSAESYNLADKTQVKEYLGISESSDDDLFDSLLNRATAFIEKECGERRFKETTYEEIYDGDDFGNELFLNQYPIIEIVKVEHNNGTTANPDWKEDKEGSDYEKYLSEGYLYFYTKYRGKRNYRITYKAGYTTIPYDLEHLCIKLVAKIYEKRKSEGIKTESLGGANINWGELLDEEDKIILDNYRYRSI